MTPMRTLVRVLLAVLVLVLVGGGWVAARGGLTGRSHPTSTVTAVATGTALVTRGDVTARDQVAGTLGYDGSYTAVNQMPGGIVTWAPSPGAVVRRGQPLYRVDGQPVRLFYGRQAAWRAFQLGMPDGPDVRQLEQNLVALGSDPNRTITVDDHFSAATQAAVRRWQGDALGLPPAQRTGAIPLGQLLFFPGPIRVTQLTATPGAAAGPNTRSRRPPRPGTS
jgi:hypothetical protein